MGCCRHVNLAGCQSLTDTSLLLLSNYQYIDHTSETTEAPNSDIAPQTSMLQACLIFTVLDH